MEPVAVEVVFRTGHKRTFTCFSFERVAAGYAFTSYPEERGYKTLEVIASDSYMSIRITAPETMMKDLELPPVAARYPTGDPQVASGPKTTLSAFNRLRQADGTPRAVVIKDKDAPPGMGRPMSAVPTFDQEGNQIDIPVGAAMIGS